MFHQCGLGRYRWKFLRRSLLFPFLLGGGFRPMKSC
jgi:hypothetical protein